MPLCLYRSGSTNVARLGLIENDRVTDVGSADGPSTLTDALTMPLVTLRRQLDAVHERRASTLMVSEFHLAAPVDRQEVWAAGVTYLRSRDARMDESTQKDVYDRVYDADRPELFLKATPNRVSGPGEHIAIRGDSTWDVPEPELVLVINSDGDIVGYTVGNDVSSRSIEGENPLYLPQAKMYTACAAVGPVIALAWEIERPDDLAITLTIHRAGSVHFQDTTSTSQIHRPLPELIRYLRRHNEFPHGVMLMTGTGIIPPPEFTLQDGDHVDIAIDSIGTLSNPVVRLSS